jgi:uncharacterized protein YcsI (UPF0317 family)
MQCPRMNDIPTPVSNDAIASPPATPLQVRQAARAGALDAPTAALAPGFVQANLVVLPREAAADFTLFCQRNPKPCPLLAVGDPGDPSLPGLGADIDIRTDVARYRVFRRGLPVEEVADVRAFWRDDLVSFLIGCSFSFEEAMLEAGLPLRHIEQKCNVPMYRTSIPTVSAGRFGGPMVVSMRPLKPADAIRAIQITSRFPAVHGAPVHFGDPAQIGVNDLARPDYGEAVRIDPGEVPVFWACGVTPQTAIELAGPEICITHAPGYMLVTDVRNCQMAAF